MIEVTRVVRTSAPVDAVAAYLSDFTTTAEWDPHTASCTRVDAGPIAVGAEFDNVQRIGPMRSTFRYRVEEYRPGERIELHSSSRTLEATDVMVFDADGSTGASASGTRVSYTAKLQLKGLAQLAEPVLRRMMDKIADEGAVGMQRELDALAATPRA
ncbi:MAG: SRPBCC family protein [Marmoricola sp.]